MSRKPDEKQAPWERARDRRGRALGRALDMAYIAALEAGCYDARAFDAWRDKALAATDDPWERLETLRRHASRSLALAQDYGRTMRELSRLFEAQRRLGYSSDHDEYLSIVLHARALGGRKAAARRLLAGLEHRLAERDRAIRHLRKTIKQDMRRMG